MDFFGYMLLAEGVGFEPTGDLRRRRFSRPVLSTAQPPLQPLNLFEDFRFFHSQNFCLCYRFWCRSVPGNLLGVFRQPRSGFKPPIIMFLGVSAKHYVGLLAEQAHRNEIEMPGVESIRVAAVRRKSCRLAHSRTC